MKLRVISASILVLGAILPLTAFAQSIGSPCIITASSSANTCASEATLRAMHTYLETGQTSSLSGAVNGGGGLIGQLTTLNAQISNMRKQDQNDFANEDVRDRNLATERAILNSIEKASRPIRASDCRSAGVSSGAFGGGAGGGGAGTNSRQAADEVAGEVQPEMLTPGTEMDYVARLVRNERNKRYCTAADQTNKVPGCSGGEGDLPGANTNPSVLIREATKAPKIGSFSVKRGSENPGYAAAIDYIRYAMPFPGPNLRASAKDTPAGRQFLVMQRRYNGRAMAVVYGLSNIFSESVALPASHPFVSKIWNGGTMGAELKKDFKEIYPTIDFPERPSERELMHLLVQRQFASTLTEKDLAESEVEYFSRRSLEVDKINAYLMLKLNEKSEWSNIMLAHILSNDIDPVTRSNLLTSATSTQ